MPRRGVRCDYVLAPTVVVAAGGDHVVHLQQCRQGLDVVGGSVTITIEPDGGVSRAVSRVAVVSDGIMLVPDIEAQEAAAAALSDLWSRHEATLSARGLQSLRPADVVIERVGRVAGSALPTILRAGTLEWPITARLVLWPGKRGCRVAWEVDIPAPEAPLHETLYVAASGSDAGRVLRFANRAPRAARCSVYRLSPDEDADRTRIDIPVPALGYPSALANGVTGFPAEWLAGIVTNGNAVAAFSHQVLAGVVDSQNDILFEPADRLGLEQAVLNLFVFCNELHDLFWLLGFREAEGNFQQRNVALAGRSGDPVRARVIEDVVDGGATMTRSRDGMPVFLVTGMDATRQRFAALDADIVFHEYTHGVTHRMVGGRHNGNVLTAPQSVAMSEGWSDYFAISLLNFRRAAPRDTIGAYFSGASGGLRRAPFDERFDAHATYGKLGSPGFTEPHDAGEIWCAALVAMERKLARQLGDLKAAAVVCWRAVFESLRRVPAEPSFLDGRDGIAAAASKLNDDGTISSQEAAALHRASNESFAWLGMGPGAHSPSSEFAGIVEDFTVAP